MKKLSLVITLLLCLLVLVSSCSAPIAADLPLSGDLMANIRAVEKPAAPAEPDSTYVNSIGTFSWKLFQESVKKDGNVLISPTSVYLALGMVLNGADTTTRTAMLNALSAQNLTVDQINSASRDWMTLLMDTGDKTKLSIVNSIWLRDGFDADQKFLQQNADYYSAAARTLDFAKPEAISTINEWVKNATNNKIDKIIDEIRPDVIMYLINAVHFKAEWQNQFEPLVTADGQFSTPGGEKTVQYMHQLTVMDYLNSEDGAGVLMPYSDGRFAFAAFLPAENKSRDAVNAMDAAAFAKLLASRQSLSVQLSLPKFETSFEASLVDALSNMAMGEAFDPAAADLSLMNSGRRKDLYIGDVKHKTYCRIDEAGTEAAAVTSVEIRETSMPESDIELDFNRPFIYGIIDTVTGLPLFLGIMDDPTAE